MVESEIPSPSTRITSPSMKKVTFCVKTDKSQQEEPELTDKDDYRRVKHFNQS
jgi:hypothetical protein